MNDKREEFKLVFLLLENFFRDGNNWYVVWWSSTLVGVVANLKSLKVRLNNSRSLTCLSRFELTGELSSDGRPHFHNYTQVLLLDVSWKKDVAAVIVIPWDRKTAVERPFYVRLCLFRPPSSGRKTTWTAHAKDTLFFALMLPAPYVTLCHTCRNNLKATTLLITVQHTCCCRFDGNYAPRKIGICTGFMLVD